MCLNLRIKEGKLYHANKAIDFPSFLNGTWRMTFSNSIGSGENSAYSFIIEENDIKKRNGEIIGEIRLIEIDKRYHTLKLIMNSTQIFGNSLNSENQLFLLKINNNELIGIKNQDGIVAFERERQ